MIVHYDSTWREELERLAHMMHEETAYRELPLDIDYGLSQAHFCVLNVRGEQANGFFLGFIGSYWFCKELAAWDRAFYVQPDARGTYAWFAMVKAYTRWAQAQPGVREIWLTQSTGIKPADTSRFIEACGFQVMGVNAVKRLSE